MRNLIGVKLVSLTHLPCINCLPQNQRWKFWLSWFHSLDAWFQLWSELEIFILYLFYLFIHSFINFLLSEGRGGVGDLYGVERFSATINNWFIRQRAFLEIWSTWEVWRARKMRKLLRIFRALQTSRVLHISMNARWHMNQLLIVEESNVYDWPFFLFANTMTVLTVDFEMVSGAHTHDKNKQYYFCFLFFAIRAISVFWRNFTRNSRVR